MNNELCRMTGAEFPLFAFSHCRDVVAAVSRAGGFGVLGGASFTPDVLEEELRWIDRNVDGKPYGVDVLIPENVDAQKGQTAAGLAAKIPQAYRDFTVGLLERYGVHVSPEDAVDSRMSLSTSVEMGEQLLEVAFRHPIRLIANALGIAPPLMLEGGRRHGVPVAALVGAKEHAVRQVNAGVDILVAQGTEAGGHCGEVSTLVLVPEVVRTIKQIRPVPVLAAGGIMTGEQMAGCMAMGAQGVWAGSVWLATSDAETSEAFRAKMVEATARDTIRSKYRTGKPSRQLRSAWHDAWEQPGSPPALPMPEMMLISQPSFNRVERAVLAGNDDAKKLVSYFVGQGVGLVESIRSATAVVQAFKEEFAEAVSNLTAAMEEAPAVRQS
jgi:NAD(P)H-dependent flavin oxidoreductase YrpB (nitropropane dioxygenase family)